MSDSDESGIATPPRKKTRSFKPRQMARTSLLYYRKCWRGIIGFCTPFALSPLLFLTKLKEAKCAFAILWIASYFITEPIPIPATALLPILLYPLLGILSTNDTCMLYFKGIIAMFLGALILAIAVEHCNLHKRIALKILLSLGSSVRWLMVGFIVVSASLSMWIINTATTAMMIPIVNALIDELKIEHEEMLLSSKKAINDTIPGENIDNKDYYIRAEDDVKENYEKFYEKLRKALLLSVAYSATCGGTGSIIGAGPNFVLLGLLENFYPDTNQITFGTWMLYNVPGMLLCLIAIFVILQYFYIGFRYRSNRNEQVRIKSVLQKKYDELGPITFHEFGVSFVFVLLLLVWLFRNPHFIEGWSKKLNSDVEVSNATPGIAASLLLFLIPADPLNLINSKRLIDWKTVERKMPWGILLLFGSGFSIAEGAKQSGLSTWITERLLFLNALSPTVILFCLCLISAALTEILTNMTISTLLLPVVHQIAIAVGVNPLFFMLPVVISCSFSFMLPVSNPPCAIVYQAGGMRTIDMAKPGFFLNIICCAIEIFMINTLGYAVFDFSTPEMPTTQTFSPNSTFVNFTLQ